MLAPRAVSSVAATLVWTALLALGDPRIAIAQGPPQPAGKVDDRAAGSPQPGAARRGHASDRSQQLAEKVDEALKAAADVPAALEALQDLQNQVIALQQQLERSRTVVRGYEAMRRKIDEYEDRIGELELRLSAITVRLAGSPHGNAGYRGGFYVQSPDQKFMLQIGGLLQGGYLGRIYSTTGRYEGTDIGQDTSSFLLRRARLRTTGHMVHRRLTYDVELDFGHADPGGPLLSASGNLQLYRGLQLRGGKFKVPFSRQMLVHSADQLFIERSPVVESFAPRWDTGATLHGELFRNGKLTYQLGVFNGAGPDQTADDNTDFLYAGRLVLSPFGPLPLTESALGAGPFRLSLGTAFFVDLTPTDLPLRDGISDPAMAAVFRDQDRDGRIDNVAVYTVAGELALRYRGLAAQGEAFYRLEDPGQVLPHDRSFWGVYGQLSYHYEPAALELGARYGFWQPPDYGVDRTLIRPQELHEVGLVIAGLPWGRCVKWQVEYTHRWLRDLQRVVDADTTQTIGDLQLHQVRLQAQLAF